MSDMEQPGSTQDSGAAESTAVEDQNLDVVDNDQQIDTGEDSQEQTEAEEFGEIEVDGKKFELPKSAAEKLQAERMMHANYTQKTQALAEERRAFEAQSSEQQKQQQEYVQEYAKVVAISDQLALYDKVDWEALIRDDPQQAMLYQQQQRALEAQRQQAVQSVTQKQQQFALNEQQTLAKQVQEASAYVTREIPNWSPERDNQLQKYVQENGIPEKAIGPILVKYPALFKILHKAEQFDQMAKKPAAKPPATVQEKPVTRVNSARSPAQRDPGKMSTAEWMAHRDSQLRKSR